MMRINHKLPLLWATLSLFVISGTSFAQGKSSDAKSRNYGVGQPKTVEELPYGQLRKQLESLPPKARGKALGWLQGFSFPHEDLKNLKVSKKGEISYSDSFLPPSANGTTAPDPSNAAAAADVLPVDAQIIALLPSSTAFVTAMVMPRSLNEPVGLRPSYFT